MYAMTAAHKSLPLPTYVRVKNLRNNKSVIVRVNDRGPFVHNRIIDLSYSAAKKLDMIKTGTSLVEITAISFDQPPDRPVVASAPARKEPKPQPTATKPVAAKSVAASAERDSTVYVQVGAFGDTENARRRFALLRSGGIGNAFVLEDNSTQPALYRIRIGPIVDVLQYDKLVAQLQNLGISDTHLVSE
jgi:rare lipoprotein A